MSEDTLNQKIKELENELDKVKKESTQYLQNVAHQLTAPLNAIKWSIEALKDEDVPLARKRNLLSSVYSQSTILVHLIKNFTLMSNLEMDHDLRKFREKPQEVDMLRLTINLANDFQPLALDSGKKIIVDDDSFSRALSKQQFLIEKNLVAQAVSNILENAIKYSDEDSVIKIAAERDKDEICILISSTGIPIKAEESSELLVRGYRGKEAIAKVPAGTGFGLYLVKRIMDFHQGKVAISTNKRLSIFKLYFPVALLK
jgi:signal transduction histidine kinase